MYKKILLFMALLLPLAALSAQQFTVGNLNYGFDTSATSGTVTAKVLGHVGGGQATGSVEIPASVTYQGTVYPVTIIDYGAFYQCYYLTSMTIPNSVVIIRDFAFGECASLLSLTIPNSVTYIGSWAFTSCGFRTLIIGSSVATIEAFAFNCCNALTSLTCLAENPPITSVDAFTPGVPVNNYFNIPIYVHCGSVAVYQAATGWSNFTNIQEVSGCNADTPDTHNVAVISIDTAWGIATVSVPGSTSGGMGWADVEDGTTVNLSATPKPGYHFVEWHENDTVYSRTADTVATITGDRFLVAFFAPDTHDVFVICNDTAMGDAGVLVVNPGAPAATIEPFAEVEHGTTVSITAIPKPGYHFVEWHEDDTLYSSAADTLVTVLADRFLVAIFAQDTHAWVNMGDGLLWATCNVGADNPWDYGDYFAWGETQTKSEYSWDNYFWGRGGRYITRYTGSDYSTLLPEDDAATVNWGGDWRMPTSDEYTALIDTDNYSWTWITNYNGTGKKGMLVTRLTGTHAGNNIFLPAAGSKTDQCHNQNIRVLYWTSSLRNIENAVFLDSEVALGNRTSYNPRYVGYVVRAVRPAPQYTVVAYTSDTTMGSVTGGGSYTHGTVDTIGATPNPGYHFVEWREADTVYSRTADTVATINGDRTFTAVFAIDQHDYVDMGDGLFWATCNLGAANPWDYGDYFAWGETSPKASYSWTTYQLNPSGDGTTFTRYTGSDYDTLLPEDDAATANWHGDWRMPTDEEWTALMNTTNYNWVWITNYNGSGINGMLVTRLTGPCADNSIFLPAAGVSNATSISNQSGSQGYYWSSTYGSGNIDNAKVLSYFPSTPAIPSIGTYYRKYGYPVRAVCQYTTDTVVVVSINDTMGSVTGGGSYAHGTTATLGATSNTGYHFVEWREADTVYSRTADTVATINGNRTFTAVFAPDIADLALTNVSCRIVGRKLCVDYQFVNQGEVDYTETIGFTVYRNHYRGEILCGGPLMVIDEDMLAFSGNVATKSYIFGRNVICSLDSEDSLVIAINDMGFGVGNHVNAQPERDTLNNIAVLHFNSIFPNRHAYSVDEQTACDSLTWIDDSTYRASTDTSFITVVSYYNGTPCDSIVRLDLTIGYSTFGDTTAVVCDSMQWHGDTYTVSAEPTQLFEAANAAGCDSTVTLHLTVNHSNTGDTTAVACDSMTWYGTTYTSTPNSTSLPSHTSTNMAGCDSVVTLHLTVNYSNTGDTTAIACDSLNWYGVNYISSTSTVSHTSTNLAGCDSVVTLHLTVNHSNTGDTTAVVCDSLNWYGETYTSTPGSTSLPSHTSTNVAGCDSVVTLHLTVNYSNTGDTTAVVCDSMAWYGTTYTSTPSSASLPSHTSTNISGCDSVVTLHLTVNYSNTSDTTAVVCDSMAWHGNTYTSSTNTASYTSTNVAGCDSVVTLNLTVYHRGSGDTTAVACDQFSWWEHTGLTESVDTLTHVFVAGNQLNCDSTVTLHLTINYQNTGDTTAVECDQFSWYEHADIAASTDSLTHLFASANQWGCDSTVTLHLTVNYQNTGDTTAVECDQFSWYEHTGITASADTLTHLFASANQWGCDSTVTLHLAVNYQNTGDTTAVECDQFTWYDTTYTATADPTHLFAGGNQWGCDSTLTLHLTINYQNTGDTTAVECDQFSWYEHSGITASNDSLAHIFAGANQWGCDSVVTLHLTINYQNTGDTTAVECDQFTWYGTNYTATADPTHLFVGGNQWGCDSTLTLHLTVNYQNTGDTTAVECDQFSWWEHTGLTTSSNTLTHLFTGGNQWGCDSTVTLNLTIHYQNTGDTTAVECDQFSWWEHTGLTASVDTLTHLLVGGNQWGCDSTVTLHLTVNYQNTGDTTAVECDQFSWYEHQNLTSSISTLTHRFVAANQWNCDSTVTLHLTVNYQNTGDTTAVECDQFSWYEHQNLTVSSNTLTHTHVGANQVNCDSVVTLHLTINYQNTGDTSAITYEPYTWYEHPNMDVTQNVEHTFAGANRWGCDSTVTLHLRYALFATNWAGPTTVIYNSRPQTAFGATYVDDTGRTQQVELTFTNGDEVITTPNYPVTAGVWNVVARPILPVDSLSGATATLTIQPATVFVSGAAVRIAKLVDGNATAEVTDIGTLNNIQGSDPLTHTTTAAFNDAAVGEGKTVTLNYALQGTAELLNNYTLSPTSEVYTTVGAILDPITPATNAFDVEVYGYCVGSGNIGYHLASGTVNQYKLDFADERFADVDWTPATGVNGTLVISVPEGMPTGDYTVDVTFRDSRFPWIESEPMTIKFHVDLPSGYVKPLFYNVIALVDTCQCFTDIQWYHRSNSGEVWQAIPGANGYYYREEAGLTGEYFVNAKMYGVSTYTCPQGDFVHLVSDGSKETKLSAWPNPTTSTVNLLIEGSEEEVHTLRVMNTVGVELENRTFEGPTTTVDFSLWQRGSYVVSVDGMIVRVVRN